MTVVKNADDFLRRFRAIRSDYNNQFRSLIADARYTYTQRGLADPTAAFAVEETLEMMLEAHSRAYFVNAFLAALNWRLDQKPEDGLGSIIPELPVRDQTGQIKFLDYLGLECVNPARPLLIVETKRPSAKLPSLISRDRSVSYIEDIVCSGLRGQKLSGEWNDWLVTLAGYVKSVFSASGIYPKRVVLTNGEWLILFLNPSESFSDEAAKNRNNIIVFDDHSSIESRFTEVFRFLDHGRVFESSRTVGSSDLPFYVTKEDIVCAMHGLRLQYQEARRVYEPSPMVTVAPIIVLRSKYGRWFCVEDPPLDYEIPHRSIDLCEHLTTVEQAAKRLLSAVNRALCTTLQVIKIEKHYFDQVGFEEFPAIKEITQNSYLILTGIKTHYLQKGSTVVGCKFHSWLNCFVENVASSSTPITIRSVEPRSFFFTEELHHCAHRSVLAAKAAQINLLNRDLAGSRSGVDGQAFCEIWRFEQHLCCRTCVFESVCTKSSLFQLPCQK